MWGLEKLFYAGCPCYNKMVLGTHVMDLMRFFAGDARCCFARVREDQESVTEKHVRDGAEGIGLLAGDEIHAVYRFDAKTMDYFSTHRTRHGTAERFGLQVYGSRGGSDDYNWCRAQDMVCGGSILAARTQQGPMEADIERRHRQAGTSQGPPATITVTDSSRWI